MPHITIPDTSPFIGYTATPAQSVFPIPFPFFGTSDIVVTVDGVTQVSGFTVTGTAVTGGFSSGTLTFATSMAGGEEVGIRRNTPILRTTDFPYPSPTLSIHALNTELDRLYAIQQERRQDAARALLVPDTDPVPARIPGVAARAGMLAGFDSSGNMIAVEPGAGDGVINAANILDATAAGRDLLTSTLAEQKTILNLQPAPTTGTVSQAVYATAPGTGYNLGDTLTVVGGTGTPATFTVISTRLVGCSVLSGGTGYAPNDEVQFIITVSGQVYVNARIRVLTVSSGAIATFEIIDSGEYGPASLPTSFTSGAITGSGTGATFNNPVWGVGQAYVATAGDYTVFPSGTVATTGPGTGATLPLAWGNEQRDLRSVLGNPVRVESYSSYLRSPGVGWRAFAGPDGAEEYIWFIINDRSAINPYTGEVLGDDSKFGLTVSDFSITSTQDRRSPENNSTKLLQTVLFQLVRDVPNPAAGSLLFMLAWAGRTTGAAFVDMYYGSITGSIVDPAPADPRGALIFSTAAPAAVPGSQAGRVWIGQGLYTAEQLVSGVATSPLVDEGVGTINAMRFYTQNGLRIDEGGNFYGNGAQLADATLSNALTAGRVYLPGAAISTLVNGDNHNVVLPNKAWSRCTGPTSVWAITGIAAGANGEVRYVFNASLQELTIKHENAGSTAANRILTPTGADVVVGTAATAVMLYYDGTGQRWIMVQ
jgi:hypothetical protein